MKRKIYISEAMFNELTKPKKKSHLNPDKWYEDKADFSISSSEGDLGYAHVVGDAGAGGMMCEDAFDTDIHKYIESYLDFLERNDYRINPRPAIELNAEPQDGMNIRTGYYDPDEQKVVVFINGRHIKDILRSFAHEMVHHMQNLQDEHMDWGHGGDLADDDKLRELEGEAYHVGNILFREWTEELKKTKKLNESRGTLNEDKEGKNLARARHYLQRLGYSQEASQNVIQMLRNEIPACRLGNYKFMLGIVRLYVEKELDNDSNKGKLFNILNSITSGPAIDAYDYNFNGKNINNLVADIEKISFEQPYGARQASVEKPKTIRANNGYTIVPIFSYEEAEQYAKFTDWCVVNNDAAYDAHTIYGGMFYFCLKDGFEEINVWDGNFDREHTPPYDVYGLSMIAVCIGPDGEERSITTRWNHRCLHGTIPVEKLEGIIGMRFSEAFKPWVNENAGYINKNEGNLNESVDWGERLRNLKKRRDPDNIENWDGLNEATESDVDLSSFKVQDKLNPKIWVNDLMDSRVRLKLMDIAQDFVEFLDVTWVKPEDTIVVGSIANYNWSRYSDIDLHIVIDYSKVDERKKFVENYFQSKKKEWNDTHDKIKIFGYPVELYVQDKDADNASSAVYSIDKNKWIKKPVRSTFTKKDIDSQAIKKRASNIMTDIEDLEKKETAADGNEYKNRKVFDDTSDLIDDITDKRKTSLSKTKDEMNTDNLVFKVLRRNGYLDKLFKLRDKTYDKMNSLS